jgi:hypothetical protein
MNIVIIKIPNKRGINFLVLINAEIQKAGPEIKTKLR